MYKKIFAFVWIFFFCFSVGVSAYYSPGTPNGFVNDFAELMSPEVSRNLATEVENFKKETQHEIAVVTVPDMRGDYIENFAEKLFREWGIGMKGLDNGVLLLISKQERQVRIEVGYGLEGILTDTQAMRVLHNFGKPYLKDDNYDQGIPAMVAEIEKIVKEEEAKPATVLAEKSINDYYWFNFICGFFLVVLIMVGIGGLTVVGKSKRYWIGGVWGVLVGLFGGLLSGDFLTTIGMILGIGGAGWLFDYIVSKKGWFQKGGGAGGSDYSSGGYSAGSSSSSSSASSSSSSSGSSSSFGGGSSGGGGASSSF